MQLVAEPNRNAVLLRDRHRDAQNEREGGQIFFHEFGVTLTCKRERCMEGQAGVQIL